MEKDEKIIQETEGQVSVDAEMEEQILTKLPIGSVVDTIQQQLLAMLGKHNEYVLATVNKHDEAMRRQMQRTYEELQSVTEELRATQAELAEVRQSEADWKKEAMGWKEVAEKRYFNVELKKNYDTLLAEYEDLKANFNKRVKERVKEAIDKIFEKINGLLKKQLDEVQATDGSHAWNKQRKFLLGIFWRIPEIGGPLDAAGDEMIENSRRAREQAEQKQGREEERDERKTEAMERQAEKPAAPIHMDVKDGGFAIGNIEELKGIVNNTPKEIEE